LDKHWKMNINRTIDIHVCFEALSQKGNVHYEQ